MSWVLMRFLEQCKNSKTDFVCPDCILQKAKTWNNLEIASNFKSFLKSLFVVQFHAFIKIAKTCEIVKRKNYTLLNLYFISGSSLHFGRGLRRAHVQEVDRGFVPGTSDPASDRAREEQAWRVLRPLQVGRRRPGPQGCQVLLRRRPRLGQGGTRPRLPQGPHQAARLKWDFLGEMPGNEFKHHQEIIAFIQEVLLASPEWIKTIKIACPCVGRFFRERFSL